MSIGEVCLCFFKEFKSPLITVSSSRVETGMVFFVLLHLAIGYVFGLIRGFSLVLFLNKDTMQNEFLKLFFWISDNLWVALFVKFVNNPAFSN